MSSDRAANDSASLSLLLFFLNLGSVVNIIYYNITFFYPFSALREVFKEKHTQTNTTSKEIEQNFPHCHCPELNERMATHIHEIMDGSSELTFSSRKQKSINWF